MMTPVTPASISSVSEPIPPFKVTKPSLLDRIKNFIQKIWHNISSMFCCFSFPTPFSTFFSQREITLLRDDRAIPRPKPTSDPAVLNDRKITPIDSTISPDTVEECHPTEPPYVIYDDSLESLRGFVRDFSSLLVDVVHDTHIEKQVESFQNIAPSLPPIIKSISKLLVEIGDKAAKPLFQRFSQQKAQVIDPALQKIFKTLLKEDQISLRDELTTYLSNEFSTTNLPRGQTLATYIKPIVQWLSLPTPRPQAINEIFPQDEGFDLKLICQMQKKGESFWETQQAADLDKLYIQLENKLVNDLKDQKISPGHDLATDYIHPILDWLLLTNHFTPVTDLFQPLDRYKEELIDKVFELAIASLVERKIDHYANLMEKTMQRRLGEIIHQTIRINASRISDFFTDRLSELISTMPYTETFDILIRDVVSTQINGVIKAEKAVEANRTLLEKTKKAAQIDPRNAAELDTKIRAENHLASVQQHGGEKEFFEHIFLSELALEAGSDHMKQIVQQHADLILQEKDSQQARKASEKVLFTIISENLLALMLPTRKRIGSNGEIEEVDPLTELWDRLYWPTEFQELIHHFDELSHEFITPETVALFSRIKQPTIDVVKSMFRAAAQDMLKKHLVTAVQKGFEKISTPESIDDINAESVLPALNMQLIEVFIYQEMGRNIKKIAPLLHKLVKEGEINRAKNFEILQNELIKLANQKFQHFNGKNFYIEETAKTLAYSDLRREDWLALSKDVIDEIEKKIRGAKIKGIPFDPIQSTEREIQDILYTDVNTPNKENNPIFGDIVMNLIFKIGGVGNEGIIGYFLKNTLSAALTNVTSDIRVSHHYIVEKIAKGLKTSLLDRKYVEELLSDNVVEASPHVAKKLAQQIETTSKLAHDIIMAQAEQKGTIIKFATTKVLTNQPTELANIIKKIYGKLFNNQIANENLVIKTCETLFHSLASASETIRHAENLAVMAKSF